MLIDGLNSGLVFTISILSEVIELFWLHLGSCLLIVFWFLSESYRLLVFNDEQSRLVLLNSLLILLPFYLLLLLLDTLLILVLPIIVISLGSVISSLLCFVFVRFNIFCLYLVIHVNHVFDLWLNTLRLGLCIIIDHLLYMLNVFRLYTLDRIVILMSIICIDIPVLIFAMLCQWH